MTKIVFMGTPNFSVPILDQLIVDGFDVAAVVTQPDRPVGRKRILTPPPVKVEAQKHNIPVYQPEKIRDSKEMKEIIALEPDIIVTAAFGQILPNDLLNAPRHGCINVHASLLPELRGGAPIHYALLEGKKKAGITIMYMVEKLDAGDMISQAEIPVSETDNVGTLHEKLSVVGAKLLSETLPKLLKDEITAIPQNEEAATFAFNIKREQEKIDWSKNGEEIYNHIRGLNPWPVAYTTIDGTVLKVWWGEKFLLTEKNSAGTVVKIMKDGFVISTGNTVGIKITEIQPSGKKRMSAEQFLNGAGSNITIGTKLGE